MTHRVDGREPADYDSNGYDYRSYWLGRDYESHAEQRALGRLIPRLDHVEWFADLGGGFGRNLAHYADVAEHAVLVDYSANNLRTAEARHYAAVDRGRLHLVRADLRALPFVDDAFDAAMVVRVLHHLPDLDRYLAEMSRTIRARWLLDVPIKHHLLARLRALRYGSGVRLDDAEPQLTGTTAGAFRLYHLGAVRGSLNALGWDTTPVASVNNLRRWDQWLPRRATAALQAPVAGIEAVAQRVGRGWWGPSQFVLARRREPARPRLRPVPEQTQPHTRGLAARMACPACRGRLDWTDFAAFCRRCGVCYRHHDGFWDFAAGVPAPVPAAAVG
ncbi:hypothetical protein Athai_36220 [Actinocatenispora thailandica]|uniref:Methyltransferase type 11 domain-containing protein n=1 Tax=Actinocatenispora thailandica TaxID=227318 RepID=A0A7R7DQU7_9ACTN|nr:class I SAM-dependent methyltransferase [Actinocatenispora thailandica]BCJ36119.1 hypothetical protein Athai_36220 [Actinocatenispora thailandica]